MGLLTEQFAYLQAILAYYIIERSPYLTNFHLNHKNIPTCWSKAGALIDSW
ncbi:MAG: hypothetical protein ACRC2M_02590 [Planktothrix sp.]